MGIIKTSYKLESSGLDTEIDVPNENGQILIKQESSTFNDISGIDRIILIKLEDLSDFITILQSIQEDHHGTDK